MGKRKQTKANKRIKCPFCNKNKKRALSYYRNGEYYCSKAHWKSFLLKEEKRRLKELEGKK